MHDLRVSMRFLFDMALLNIKKMQLVTSPIYLGLTWTTFPTVCCLLNMLTQTNFFISAFVNLDV